MILFALAFWMSIIGIHSKDIKSQSTGGSCLMFPHAMNGTAYDQSYYLPTSFQLQKQIWKLWDWEYDANLLNNNELTMTQACSRCIKW